MNSNMKNIYILRYWLLDVKRIISINADDNTDSDDAMTHNTQNLARQFIRQQRNSLRGLNLLKRDG